MDSTQSSKGTKIECLLFDMDDTLYPMSSGLNMACRKNIEEYMLHHLKIEESEVPKMCLDLYKEHGTTMAGLKALGYEFDNDEFHAYIHGRLPYEKLKPDPVLRNILLSTPQRKIIFTNADKAHAVQVLYRLGLEDCFEGIICFETLNNTPLEPDNYDDKVDSSLVDSANFYLDEPDEFGLFTARESIDHTHSDVSAPKSRILCKPSQKAIEAAIRIADIDPKKTIFFDDSVRNIASAKTAGLHTVIVGSSVLVPGADLALSSIHNMREALPEIWEGEEDQLEPVMQSTAVETVVLA
ncbi:HAD-like domain [Macleaya cordata]|uniref:HAD-like domain n=1 Tax=Macleaya cordata TaxID=56857 RepID=A0A200R1L8_MACCD|nr:HAD-like domain [Macleaya cordata]